MKLIYGELEKKKDVVLKKVVIEYDQQGIKQNFLYMLNCIKQLFIINTSHVVIIRDNNYVVSTFKRKGVKVIQVWHACGAIKKFGNALRESTQLKITIMLLLIVLIGKSLTVKLLQLREENVVITGMPRVDWFV